MNAEPNKTSEQCEGTERYAEFLSSAVDWLHYDYARIDELTKAEVNELARLELERRKSDGSIEDDPRKVWAWLFVSYTLRDDDRE